MHRIKKYSTLFPFFKTITVEKEKQSEKKNENKQLSDIEVHVKIPLHDFLKEGRTDKLACLFEGKYDDMLSRVMKTLGDLYTLRFDFCKTGETYNYLRAYPSGPNDKSTFVLALTVDNKEDAIKAIKDGRFHEVIKSGSSIEYLLNNEGEIEAYSENNKSLKLVK